MAYVPLNPQVFVAALAGALAGLTGGARTPTDPLAADDAAPVAIAAAFAQSFDTQWGAATAPNALDTAAIQTICEATWNGRGAPPSAGGALLPATYNAWTQGLIAEVKAGDAWYVANVGPVPVGGLFLGVSAPLTYAAGIVGVPNATAAAAGVVSTVAQTFGGTKTFANGMVLPAGQNLSLTQGGTLATPASEHPVLLQPRDSTRPAGGIYMSSALFNVTIDNVLSFGWNSDSAVLGQPGAVVQFEWPYERVPGELDLEAYIQIQAPGGASQARPIFAQYVPATGRVSVVSEFRATGGGTWSIVNAASGLALVSMAPGQLIWSITGAATDLQLDAVGGLSIPTTHLQIGATPSTASPAAIRLTSDASCGIVTPRTVGAAGDMYFMLYQPAPDTLLIGAGFQSTAQSANIIRYEAVTAHRLRVNGATIVEVDAAAILVNIPTAVTVGAAGAAAALPANPLGYWPITFNGVAGKVPFYNP